MEALEVGGKERHDNDNRAQATVWHLCEYVNPNISVKPNMKDSGLLLRVSLSSIRPLLWMGNNK